MRFAGAWRQLCLHQRQDGLISELFSGILFRRVAVSDYDGVRAAAAASAKQQIQQVRGYVAKFGQAQRAAESTLDMCLSWIRDRTFSKSFAKWVGIGRSAADLLESVPAHYSDAPRGVN